MSTQKKFLSLYGFNNLTKNLSLSLYKVNYLSTELTQIEYNKIINERYNSKILENWLVKIAHAIGGNVLNIAAQDYSPQGASVTLLISEEAKPESLVAHLDKSHICIHTYPEENPQAGIAIFRADIELSTCGVISPLNILNYIIREFAADVVDIDFRVRGMTRDTNGQKCFNDFKITTLSSHINASTKEDYQIIDSHTNLNNVLHSRLMRKEVQIENHLFNIAAPSFNNKKSITNTVFNGLSEKSINKKIYQEMNELFNKDLSEKSG
jgi:S-adenosylmethionine decarboxylase